jgi:hypothetical protein
MKLSPENIAKLQKLLKQELGLDYSEIETNEAGLAIIRFVEVKRMRVNELRNVKGDGNGQASKSQRASGN